jgi:hypothetical protein
MKAVPNGFCLRASLSSSRELAAFKIYRSLNPYLDRQIADSLTLSSDWREIKPEKPLEIERQVQYLYVHTAETFPINSTSGFREIRLADGSTVRIEAELIDEQGRSYPLEPSSFSLADRTRTDIGSGVGFNYRDLPRDRAYSVVRLRSNKPIQLSKVIWRNYNQWDRK